MPGNEIKHAPETNRKGPNERVNRGSSQKTGALSQIEGALGFRG